MTGVMVDPTPEKWLAYHRMQHARITKEIASKKFKNYSKPVQGATHTALRIEEEQIAKYTEILEANVHTSHEGN